MAAGAVLLASAAGLWLAGPAQAMAGETLTCSSDNYHFRHCPADTRGGVRLLQQLSSGRGRCVQGESWGWDRRGVWVKDGCRGRFRTGRGTGWGHGRPPAHAMPRLEGRRFGDLAGPAPHRRGPAVSGPRSFTLDCASQGYGHAFCFADTSGGIALEQQYSRGNGACREGHSWGVTRRGIWVDKGCRARFRIWPARARPRRRGGT